MKTLVKILLSIINFIVIILSVAFIVIEARLLFSLDFTIYDNILNGFIRYFLRLILAIYVLIIGILVYGYLNKKNKKLLISILSTLIISIILLFTTTNYVGLVCFGLSIIYSILSIINYKFC